MRNMYMLVGLIVISVMEAGTLGCTPTFEPAPTTTKILIAKNEIVPLVYDDQVNTAYIRAIICKSSNEDCSEIQNSETIITDLIAQKNKWQKLFPTKKVMAMTIVPGPGVGWHQAVNGLLIHYERIP